MLNPSYNIPTLPPKGIDFESAKILKALSKANRALAEVKGKASAIPNQGILIDTLALQEAKASSEIENIVTTHDELFKSGIDFSSNASGPAKEVSLYREAVKLGFKEIKKKGSITNNTIIEIFRLLKQRSGGFRSTPGTVLRNDNTGETIYVPTQNPLDIQSQMSHLELFINDESLCDLDPLIKMAIIHHQFESIHPFPDGNGRIGRMLNILYLTQSNLLEIPILYLSRKINSSKNKYYQLLQEVRDDNAWEEWVIYILQAVAETSEITLVIIEGIRDLMARYKFEIRGQYPKIYSQDLINNLFRHPYTRIDFLHNDIGKSRQTCAKYLDVLAEGGFLIKHQIGRDNYYVNSPLVSLFSSISQ